MLNRLCFYLIIPVPESFVLFVFNFDLRLDMVIMFLQCSYAVAPHPLYGHSVGNKIKLFKLQSKALKP